jgi:hypothetical protein
MPKATVKRDSRCESVAPGRSIFASSDPGAREHAVWQTLAKRRQELDALKAAFERASDPARQRHLLQRIRATENNIKSWVAYLDEDSPRVSGATIEP